MGVHSDISLGILLLTACARGPSLGPAQTVVAHGAANPTVAVDARSGAVYVAWLQMAPDSSWDVYLSRKDRDRGFGVPIRVNDRPGEAMVSRENPPQVAVGSDGTIYVGWVSDRAPGDSPHSDVSVRVARSRDGGGSFAPSVTLDVDPGVRSLANMYYDLATGPDTTLYVSWLDLHYYTDSLAAHKARRLPDTVPVPENRVDLRVARSTDRGRSFEGQAVLDSSSCICCRTAIAAGPDGSVHTLWRHVFPGNVRDLTAARSMDGAESFAAPVRVHDDGWVLYGCPDIGPDIAVSEGGAVHAAWYTGAPGRTGLWYARSTDRGTSFSAPVALLPAGHVPPSQVKLATAYHHFWAVWEDRRGNPVRIRFGTPGEGRGVAVGEGEFPTIAAGGRTLGVVWQKGGAVMARVADVGPADD